MFGKNQVASRRTPADGFRVHSIFYTIQGEGPYAGRPALFVRMAGCNLRCFWCDTEFEKGAEDFSLRDLAVQIVARALNDSCPLIVVTGGEPLLQPIGLLIREASTLAGNLHWQIETSGSVWPTGGFPSAGDGNISIVVSPKTPRVAPELFEEAGLLIWWKYILRHAEPTDPISGLPVFSTQLEGQPAKLFVPAVEDPTRIFVQACDEHEEGANQRNLRFVVQTALRYGYRISVQTHKILNVE